jgi:hypothetical protein
MRRALHFVAFAARVDRELDGAVEIASGVGAGPHVDDVQPVGADDGDVRTVDDRGFAFADLDGSAGAMLQTSGSSDATMRKSTRAGCVTGIAPRVFAPIKRGGSGVSGSGRLRRDDMANSGLVQV